MQDDIHLRREPAKVVNVPSWSGLKRMEFNRPYFWIDSANPQRPSSFRLFRSLTSRSFRRRLSEGRQIRGILKS